MVKTAEHTSVSVSRPTSNINNFVHKTRAEQTKNGWAGVVLGLHNKQTHRVAHPPPLSLLAPAACLGYTERVDGEQYQRLLPVSRASFGKLV